MIIIEGTDNSGKTRLTSELATALKLSPKNIQHSPRDTPWPEVINWAINAINAGKSESLSYSKEGAKNHTMIYDRFPLISEQIYGPTIRSVNRVDEGRYWNIYHRLLVEGQPLVIYCRPPFNQIIKKWEERDQMKGVRERLIDLIKAYDKFMFELAQGYSGVMTYDYTCFGGLDIIKTVAKHDTPCIRRNYCKFVRCDDEV